MWAAAEPREGALTEQAGAFFRATGRTAEQPSADQVRYRRFQFELIAPHCGRSVLEVGSGLGEFSAQFTDLDRLVLTDVDPEALRALRARFPGAGVEVVGLDLDGQAELDTLVDSVVAVNVLEHIEDDVAALRALARLVRPGGTLVLWVPGYMWLYGGFDRRVGHHRRYTPATLQAAATAAGLAVDACHPVNLLGALAWWVAVRLGGTGTPRPGLVRAYDRLVVPATRFLERRVRPPFGQSVLCVARRPA